ncbi:uncharacterized protein MYCFIDRAFT_179295 [Pseudocercospora fijiensis CIRAD86]|uniref:Uncharacterized protein n=1 Tax=Pseudocercospora fijiensis (strain CIRAD86) TaxID=383855 RepID=M3AK39_PSEFD|nr:uncharacterized protein MYCFIDRAFT_179295 [Pseudocercospora fijiensis CIRAD86]EME77812.1 hypothetical protein MYCFIDRAFT_179295 [Pseudocercospora fijiensis CIRAD86]
MQAKQSIWPSYAPPLQYAGGSGHLPPYDDRASSLWPIPSLNPTLIINLLGVQIDPLLLSGRIRIQTLEIFVIRGSLQRNVEIFVIGIVLSVSYTKAIQLPRPQTDLSPYAAGPPVQPRETAFVWYLAHSISSNGGTPAIVRSTAQHALFHEAGSTADEDIDSRNFDIRRRPVKSMVQAQCRLCFDPNHSARDGVSATSTNSSGPSTPNSALGPPLHYHHSQDETFQVTAGRAAFYTYQPRSEGLWDIFAPLSSYTCKVEVAGPEQSVLIPKGVVHTFRNASSEDVLELEFALSPTLSSLTTTGLTNEEIFFRNSWSYRQDCAKAAVGRSLLQAVCFSWQGGVVVMLPGCGRLLSRILGAIGALFGRYVMGYQSSYDEYAPMKQGN